MMKGKRTWIMVCAVATAFTHLGAEAASGTEGLEACVSALAKELAEEQGAAVAVRISDDSDTSDRRLQARTRFYLDARDSRSQEVVARADCDVDYRARVKRLIRLPEDAPDADARSL